MYCVFVFLWFFFFCRHHSYVFHRCTSRAHACTVYLRHRAHITPVIEAVGSRRGLVTTRARSSFWPDITIIYYTTYEERTKNVRSAIRRKRRDSSFCAPRSRRPVLYAQFNARPEHARRVVIKILKIVLLFTIRPRPQNERTEQRTTAVFFSHIPRGWCEKLVYFLYRVSDFGGRWCFFFFFCLFCCCCLFCCVAKRASENTNECICKTLSGCGARNAPPPSESEKKNKSYGLFFSYLHSCSPPIIHGNLTCDTIFIQHNGLVKIGSGKVPHERNMPCKGKHIYQKKKYI